MFPNKAQKSSIECSNKLREKKVFCCCFATPEIQEILKGVEKHTAYLLGKKISSEFSEIF